MRDIWHYSVRFFCEGRLSIRGNTQTLLTSGQGGGSSLLAPPCGGGSWGHPGRHCLGPIMVCCGPMYVLVILRTGPSVESKDVSRVDETLLYEVEADVYWCLTKLLDNIQVERGERSRPFIRPALFHVAV